MDGYNVVEFRPGTMNHETTSLATSNSGTTEKWA